MQEVRIFAHGKKKKLLATDRNGRRVRATPVVANGDLYVMTENKLYAIKAKMRMLRIHEWSLHIERLVRCGIVARRALAVSSFSVRAGSGDAVIRSMRCRTARPNGPASSRDPGHFRRRHLPQHGQPRRQEHAHHWSVEEGKRKTSSGWPTSASLATAGRSLPTAASSSAPTTTAARSQEVKGDKAVLMCFAAKTASSSGRSSTTCRRRGHPRRPCPKAFAPRRPSRATASTTARPAARWSAPRAKDGKIDLALRHDEGAEGLAVLLAATARRWSSATWSSSSPATASTSKASWSPRGSQLRRPRQETGKLVWQKQPAGRQHHRGPVVQPGLRGGQRQAAVIFPGGDGWLYALEPKTGKLIWKFDCNPTQPNDDKRHSAILSWPPRSCMATGSTSGSASTPTMKRTQDRPLLVRRHHQDRRRVRKNENFDPQDPVNKNSALVWHFWRPVISPCPKGPQGARSGSLRQHGGRPRRPGLHRRGSTVSSTASTPRRASNTGSTTSRHAIWGSPYWVDGKVYLGPRTATCMFSQHGKKYQLPPAMTWTKAAWKATPVVANGVLYIVTRSKLYAIGGEVRQGDHAGLATISGRLVSGSTAHRS